MNMLIDVPQTGEPDSAKTGDEGGVDIPAVTSPENPVASDALEQRLADTDDKLSKLLLLFQERIQDDLVKGQLFEKLYHDLTNYREDFVFKNITQRVFNDVICLFDRVDGMLGQGILDGMQRDDLIAHVRSFRNEIIQVLRRQEVSLIESKPGRFDETFQEALDTRSVSHPAEDQTVVGILRSGFNYKGRLLRPEQVIVGRFSEKKEGNENG